jgi:hypothetical protein
LVQRLRPPPSGVGGGWWDSTGSDGVDGDGTGGDGSDGERIDVHDYYDAMMSVVLKIIISDGDGDGSDRSDGERIDVNDVGGIENNNINIII